MTDYMNFVRYSVLIANDILQKSVLFLLLDGTGKVAAAVENTFEKAQLRSDVEYL